MNNTDSAMPEPARKFVLDFIAAVRWKTAKSYSNTTPHEYTIREWRPESEEDFEQMVLTIREYGHQENFYSKIYIYIYVGTFKYWTMGDLLENTIVINRAPIDSFYGKQYFARPSETYWTE